MTTGKTIALTIQTFVGKVMSLLFNMLSRFAIAFLPRSKHLLITCLQSPSAVILESKKIMSVTLNNSGLFSGPQVSYNRTFSFLKLSILQISSRIFPNLKIGILKAQSFSSSDSGLQTDLNISTLIVI